jgi:hypothetical protein
MNDTKKRETKSFVVDTEIRELINNLKQKHNIEFETTKDLIKFLLTLAVNENDFQPERIEIEKPLPENSILMQFNEKEYQMIIDISDMCEIVNYSKSPKELFMKLINISHQRGELILTNEDYEILKEKRANNE